jgi:two-component system response regulator AlgR
VARHEGGEALLDESLVSLEQEFGEQFIRIHRNALVARDALVGLEKDSLGRVRAMLRDCDERLDISRRHVAAVRKLLK